MLFRVITWPYGSALILVNLGVSAIIVLYTVATLWKYTEMIGAWTLFPAFCYTAIHGLQLTVWIKDFMAMKSPDVGVAADPDTGSYRSRREHSRKPTFRTIPRLLIWASTA